MDSHFPIAVLLTMIGTILVSARAFRDEALVNKWIFDPYSILAYKEYYRLISSALLHRDVNHLMGNMITLIMFGRGVEEVHGAAVFLVIYIGSVLGGSALSLWLHRNHEYRALGASGGVCGILFAWILLFPGGGVALFFFPIGIPGWMYAIGYLGYSFYALKHGRDNVGHDAHIGGAVIGLLLAAAFEPSAVMQSPWLFSTLFTFSSLMFLYLWKNPLMLPLKYFLPERRSTPSYAKPGLRPLGKRANVAIESEVDRLLEKVSQNGLHSLSAKERKLLETAAKRLAARG